MRNLRIAVAQMDQVVGGVAKNLEAVLRFYRKAVEEGAQLVTCPELTLIGYPPFDLMGYGDIIAAQDAAIERLKPEVGLVGLVIGIAERNYGPGKPYFNEAVLIRNGEILFRVKKANLPNYGEFREDRWFEEGKDPLRVVEYDGIRLALVVCEDLWAYRNRNESGQAFYGRNVLEELKPQCPDVIVSINASPWHLGKRHVRSGLVYDVWNEFATGQGGNRVGPIIVYTNRVGGQDELVFDGASFAIKNDGRILAAALPYREELLVFDTESAVEVVCHADGDARSLYEAIVLAVRDYASRNGFRKAVLGLSGGIDSAVTLAIAADALGAENVTAVMMPFAYTAPESIADAEAEAGLIGAPYRVHPIGTMYEAFRAELAADFSGKDEDVTEENLQARCRGVILMAISNKEGSLVLTTGNRSENAVGYSTLYGDMAGGFNVLKDVAKGWVYELARYRNERSPVIPERVITRAPSAELAPGQRDQDSLPPYEILDAIVGLYTIGSASEAEIIAQGFDPGLVRRIIRMVDRAEYKRRQAPPGPKVTGQGLSAEGGRHVPISFSRG